MKIHKLYLEANTKKVEANVEVKRVISLAVA